MKKLALIAALSVFAPALYAAPTASTESFDFWAWVQSLIDSESAADAPTNSIQDESRSFTSIIR
jgi:hypothetical protein